MWCRYCKNQQTEKGMHASNTRVKAEYGYP